MQGQIENSNQKKEVHLKTRRRKIRSNLANALYDLYISSFVPSIRAILVKGNFTTSSNETIIPGDAVKVVHADDLNADSLTSRASERATIDSRVNVAGYTRVGGLHTTDELVALVALAVSPACSGSLWRCNASEDINLSATIPDTIVSETKTEATGLACRPVWDVEGEDGGDIRLTAASRLEDFAVVGVVADDSVANVVLRHNCVIDDISSDV